MHDGDGNGDRDGNRDDMIQTKHYINSIIEVISTLSNIIAITTTAIHCRPLFVNIL